MEQQAEIKPLSNLQILLLLGIMIFVLEVIGLQSQAKRNGLNFREFAKTVNSSEIQQIEIQRIESSGIPIIIKDEPSISKFVLMLKTSILSQTLHPITQNETQITIKLKNGKVREFTCYTVDDTGKIMYIGYVFFSKNENLSYSFGNGYTEFPDAGFYDWLGSIGVKMDK